MSDGEIYQRVRAVMDEEIRPSLKIHGGDVSLLDISEDGRIQLEFEGACRGCALQSVTYAVGVRQRLLEVAGISDVTMLGVKVSETALNRIAEAYKGYSFQMRKPSAVA
jgi:Fe-S cluster biogenesis protein NfuA